MNITKIILTFHPDTPTFCRFVPKRDMCQNAWKSVKSSLLLRWSWLNLCWYSSIQIILGVIIGVIE